MSQFKSDCHIKCASFIQRLAVRLQVRFSTPGNGSTVRDTVTVSALASGSVAKVRLYLDGRLMTTVSGRSASYVWNTTLLSRGAYSWRAVAEDSAGSTVATSAVSVTVNNVETTTVSSVTVDYP